jgi:hypothetical protein
LKNFLEHYPVENILQQFRLVEASGPGDKNQVKAIHNQALNELNRTFTRTRDAALPMGLDQVSEALKTSTKDGPHDQHAALLTNPMVIR